ncbi:MAG: hypothetical protein LBB60_02295 [Desulfovibrio sp.]|jgi:transposase|nr:hypothetical protein [Desulfovibrio sp.]
MSQAYFIGLDIAKNVFQVFSADEKGKAIANKKMGRSAVKEYFVRLAPCTIGIEVCGTSHYWARILTAIPGEMPETRIASDIVSSKKP